MLRAVASLGLPDAWIAAGAVRNAMWDALHCYARSTPLTDVDVIWFDPAHATAEIDAGLEDRLRELLPDVTWSVKNQARMHTRNGDAPYTDCMTAMCVWPETATAVAARLGPDDMIELAAPFGLDDLVALRLRPTPHFAAERRAVFLQRVVQKHWLELWPRLTVVG